MQQREIRDYLNLDRWRVDIEHGAQDQEHVQVAEKVQENYLFVIYYIKVEPADLLAESFVHLF